MRYQGRIVDWKDDRGFGFIETNGTCDRVFVHVSHLRPRGSRPVVGTLVTYEVTADAKGRAQARQVALVQKSGETPAARRSLLVPVFTLGVAMAAIAYVGWVRVSHPNSTVPASVYKIVFAREALRASASFQCEAVKTSCSAMTSCAEAFFHLERCAVPNMDGDRDGIPCERQWCD